MIIDKEAQDNSVFELRIVKMKGQVRMLKLWVWNDYIFSIYIFLKPSTRAGKGPKCLTGMFVRWRVSSNLHPEQRNNLSRFLFSRFWAQNSCLVSLVSLFWTSKFDFEWVYSKVLQKGGGGDLCGQILCVFCYCCQIAYVGGNLFQYVILVTGCPGYL